MPYRSLSKVFWNAKNERIMLTGYKNSIRREIHPKHVRSAHRCFLLLHRFLTKPWRRNAWPRAALETSQSLPRAAAKSTPIAPRNNFWQCLSSQGAIEKTMDSRRIPTSAPDLPKSPFGRAKLDLGLSLVWLRLPCLPYFLILLVQRKDGFQTSPAPKSLNFQCSVHYFSIFSRAPRGSNSY